MLKTAQTKLFERPDQLKVKAGRVEELCAKVFVEIVNIKEKLDGLKVMLKLNIRSDGNPDGFLLGDPAEYDRCLDIQMEQLKDRLNADQKIWEDAVKQAERDREAYEAELKTLTEEQQSLVGSFYSPPKKIEFNTRTLPLFGT